ncbi:MAG: 5'-3' exonuclease [Steroidobacteraceae bacterium]
MIFLIDASVYVFRAYHSQLPDRVDGDGNPVHAVFGFARFLGDLLERIRPRYVAVAFDKRLATSYRNTIYPAYKANREPAPAGLARQFEYCRELCRHLGLAAFVDPQFEADDLIGTLSCLMRAEGIRSAFITCDKDLAQLVRDGDLLWDFGARTQLGYRDVQRRFGVAPEGFADFLALTGDTSDNIPGVPGIGPKIAATLMRKFGSLDELYANIGSVAALGLRGGSALGERLTAHREAAFLARRLTRIVCDLPLGVSASDLRPRTPDLAALGALYDRLRFGTLLRRQGERLAGQPAAAAAS